MSEQYKYQASFKFGLGQTGMLNVRADTPEEFKAQLDALTATDLLGELSGINGTIKALDAVEQAGLQPAVVGQTPPAAVTTGITPPQSVTTTPLQQYQQGAVQSAQQPQVPQQPVQDQQWGAPQGPPIAAPGALPVCIHGQKQVLSKQKPDGTRWYSYACPARRDDPTKCEMDFPGFNGADMPDHHKQSAKYL